MKRKNYLLASLAVLLVCALAIGGTLAYLTATEEVTNKFVVGNIDPDIDEPDWPEPPVVEPGDTINKNPYITAGENSQDMYFRIVMEITEKDGTTKITNADRLDLIFKTLYKDLDAAYKHGTGLDKNLKTSDSYSLSDLAALISGGDIEAIVRADMSQFKYDTTRSAAGIYYYNYSLNSGIFSAGDPDVYFMTHVVVPTDFDSDDCKLLGEYNVTFKLQAIQASNFSGSTAQEDAMTALDAQLA